jgi:hypothetical protein
MSVFFVLICVVSLTLRSPISLNIYNLREDFILRSPVYFIHGGKWHVALDQEIGADAVMKNRIESDSEQGILEGILAYRVKYIIPPEFAQSVSYLIQSPDLGLDMSEIILLVLAKLAQGELTCIQLLIAWRIEHTKEIHVRAFLVEHDREFNLDEDKLEILHQKYWHVLKARVNPIDSTLLSNYMTQLVKVVRVMNEGYRWDIFITRGSDNDVWRPFWIDEER